MLGVQTSLPPTPSSVPAARQRVREALEGSPPELVKTAELLVAELVSNAIRHAGTPLVVAVAHEALGTARLEVTDDSAELPRRKDANPERMHGYGLMLLDGLSTEWGVRVTPGQGKTVWCRVGPEGAH